MGSFHSRSMWFSLQSVMSGAEGGIGGPKGSLAVMGFRDSRLSDSPSGLTARILNLYWWPGSRPSASMLQVGEVPTGDHIPVSWVHIEICCEISRQHLIDHSSLRLMLPSLTTSHNSIEYRPWSCFSTT